MEEKVKKILEEHGLTIDQLTPQEVQQLKQEIVAQEKGLCILDGVLSDPSLFYRGWEKRQSNISED